MQQSYKKAEAYLAEYGYAFPVKNLNLYILSNEEYLCKAADTDSDPDTCGYTIHHNGKTYIYINGSIDPQWQAELTIYHELNHFLFEEDKEREKKYFKTVMEEGSPLFNMALIGLMMYNEYISEYRAVKKLLKDKTANDDDIRIYIEENLSNLTEEMGSRNVRRASDTLIITAANIAAIKASFNVSMPSKARETVSTVISICNSLIPKTKIWLYKQPEKNLYKFMQLATEVGELFCK